MKAHELREMSVEELENLVTEKSEDLLNMRMQLKMRRIDNPCLLYTSPSPRDPE